MADLTTRAETELNKLIASDGVGLYTSNGLLFNHTIFGRDVSMIGRWLLELGPGYRVPVREVILTLAGLQGLRRHWRSEEEPGRILNQFKHYKNWETDWWLRQGGRIAGLAWGGNWEHELSYIGLDSTPLFVMLVCAYAKDDPSILGEPVMRRDGSRVTVQKSLLQAVHWIIDHRDRNGLVSSQRRNPFSLFFQSWRDSHLAYLYPDGHLASLSRPVAYLEVQAFAVDALRAAAEVLEGSMATEAAYWRQQADELVTAFIEHFWLPDSEYFASAIDTGRHEVPVPIPTPTSSAGWLLDSTMFNGLSADLRQQFITCIVRRLGSSEFMTPAGVRTRGNGSDSGLGVADYHGSWTVWPVDSYVLARGLRRQGLPSFAAELERRITTAVERGGSFYEFFLVSPAGEVLWRPHEVPKVVPVRKINLQILPERDLGWTITACLMIGRQHINPAAHGSWRTKLDSEVVKHLGHIPHQSHTESPFGIRNGRGIFRVTSKAVRALFREYILHQ